MPATTPSRRRRLRRRTRWRTTRTRSATRCATRSWRARFRPRTRRRARRPYRTPFRGWTPTRALRRRSTRPSRRSWRRSLIVSAFSSFVSIKAMCAHVVWFLTWFFFSPLAPNSHHAEPVRAGRSPGRRYARRHAGHGWSWIPGSRRLPRSWRRRRASPERWC